MESTNEIRTKLLDDKKEALYQKLILSEKILKCSVEEAIEVISGLDQLKDLYDQSSHLFLDSVKILEGKAVDKIIIRYHKSSNIIYWSPTSILDYFTVSGIVFNQTGDVIFETYPVDHLVTFLAKDIKRSFDNIVLVGEVDEDNVEVFKNLLKNVMDSYFLNEFPIRDNNYYFFNIEENRETHEVTLKLIRDIRNSPRPQKNKLEDSDSKVVKTVIDLND